MLAPEVINADAFFFQLWRNCEALSADINHAEVVQQRYGEVL